MVSMYLEHLVVHFELLEVLEELKLEVELVDSMTLGALVYHLELIVDGFQQMQQFLIEGLLKMSL